MPNSEFEILNVVRSEGTFDERGEEVFETRILELETKLEDTVELLHLWMNEAYAYRHLVEMMVSDRVSLTRARELLDLPCAIDHLPVVSLGLSEEESAAIVSVAAGAKLDVPKFLWACVDAMVNSRDDPDGIKGCREAANRRFKNEVLSEWGGG